MRRSSILFAVLAWSFVRVPAQTNRIYLAPDDHTDYLWSGHVSDYETWIPQMLDHYLDLNDATAGNAVPYQHKWNCDGYYWVDIFKRNRPAAQFNRLIGQLQSGKMTVPLNALVVTHGGNTTEGVIRGSIYAGKLERQYGFDIPIAISMENQTQPLGLASLWAGMGAQYSWKGVCGCATQVTGLGSRSKEIYRYTGLDGQNVLMKWYSLTYNQGLGGYAEAFVPNTAVDQCLAKINTAPYPFTVAGAFGRGWDNPFTLDSSFPAVAQNRSNATTQCHVSNMKDFFQDFEATHGASLTSQSLSFGNEWDLDCASIAEVTARVRRGIERLRGAEAVATLAARYDPAVWSSLDSLRERAMIAIGLYWEHNFGIGGVADANERATWERGLEATITTYSNTLLTNALASLGSQIPSGGELRYVVVNPLGHTRTDVADLLYSGALPVQVVDRTTMTAVPSQTIFKNGQQFIRILASNVPSAGYKVYTVQAGSPPALPNTATLIGHTFESDRYAISMSGEGVVTSLVDKLGGNTEYVTTVGGRFMNDLGAGTSPGGDKVLENNGPVSATVHTTGVLPLDHEMRITLYKDLDRIDIEDRITENFNATHYWTFCVQVGLPIIRHEELGAILKAKLSTSGGHYSTQNARYDHLSVGHFADISNEVYGNGVTFSTLGPAFFKLGSSTASLLDQNSNQINFVAGGNFQGSGPGIPDQHGDTQFNSSFSLRPHATFFDQVNAMRGALEHQNPLIAGVCTGTGTAPYPATSFSLLTSTDPDVLLWALKPAEEGIAAGVIVRYWNVSNSSRSTDISSPVGLVAAQSVTHIETNIQPLSLNAGVLTAAFTQQQMRSFRLTPNTPGVQVNVKTWLEGPYDNGASMMRDDLRSASLIPAMEPYSALGFVQVGGGGESVAPAVLAVTGGNAIVDWVLVEARDASAPSTILATRCALLQRDGDVVATDGVSPVTLQLPAGSYKVALRHRNHLGVMTADAIALSGSPAVIDFRSAGTVAYGTEARKSDFGTLLLWAGNTLRDTPSPNLLKYTGADNDRDEILLKIGGSVPTSTVAGYFVEDVNLSGVVKYTGQFNDRDPILVNIGGAVPTTTRVEQLP